MGTIKELLTVARKELGNTESPPNSNLTKYGKWMGLDGQPWCMSFVQWCCEQVGVKLPLRTGSCGKLMQAAQAAGCWVVRNFQPGDVVIYDLSGKQKTTQHCGIVEMELPDYGVQAIEGNTSNTGSQDNGGAVLRKNRPSKYIIGAVRPQFDPEKEDDMDKETFKKMWLEMRKDLQDNDSGSYSQEAREWSVKTGLIQGGGKLPDGSDNYMWEDLLTREQMATLLFRFAKMVGAA